MVDEAFANLDPDVSLRPFLDCAPALLRRDWLQFGLTADEAGFARRDATLGNAAEVVARSETSSA